MAIGSFFMYSGSSLPSSYEQMVSMILFLVPFRDSSSPSLKPQGLTLAVQHRVSIRALLARGGRIVPRCRTSASRPFRIPDRTTLKCHDAVSVQSSTLCLEAVYAHQHASFPALEGPSTTPSPAGSPI